MPALDGLRILDMTQYEAGTACTQALAWMGADVVKIERPGTGDPARGFRTPDRDAVDSEYFINWNSNKRSVTVNLQEPAGRQLLLDMVPHYDVFTENYGPGVIEKLDLGYDVMKSINPGIIYARIKASATTVPMQATNATTWWPRPRRARFRLPANRTAHRCGRAQPRAIVAPACKWPWQSPPRTYNSSAPAMVN